MLRNTLLGLIIIGGLSLAIFFLLKFLLYKYLLSVVKEGIKSSSLSSTSSLCKETIFVDFLKIKQKFANELNIEFRIYEVNEDWGRKKIRKYISQIVRHKTIQGAIIQLPLSEKLSYL